MNRTVRTKARQSGKAKNHSLRAKDKTAAQQVVRLRAEVAHLRAEIRALKNSPTVAPVLPPPDAEGNYPATETLRVLLAQKIIRGREAAGWTQAELAARAGVRQETISRLETGKHAPNVRTVDKIDRALRSAGV
jgi:DNA-binding XRE family transcriptional regulator